MKKKIFIFGMIIVLAGLLGFNFKAKHAEASCIPDPTGFYICPIPAPSPGATVDTSAPAPNSIHENPPTTTWPDGGAWVGGKQPFYDVGNDTAYPKSFNNIPIYMRAGDSITVSVTNASPDCQATDAGTGLKYPDYSTNVLNGGPPTSFSIRSNGNDIRGPKIENSTDPCSDTVDFTNPIPASAGERININGQPVDANGISGSGYIRVVWLHVSILPGSTVQGENAFRVRITNTGNDSELSSGSDAVGYGYREAPLANGNVFTQQLVFGADESCTNFAQKRDGLLQYTDMDATNLSWNPNIRIVLQREAWNNGSNDIPPFSNWNTIETISNATLRGQANNVIHSLNTQQFDFHFRYRLLLENVGVRNTIFIALGGDISQISGKYHLTGDDCSTFSCKATPDPIDALKVDVVLKNEGPFLAGKGFQLRQTPDSQDWPTTANGGFSSNFTVGGTAPFKFTIPNPAAIESYTLYDGTGASANAVGSKPLCKIVRTVTATCTDATTTATPGIPFNYVFTMQVFNPTGKTYLASDGYHMVATPDGAGVTGSTQTVNVPIPFLLGPRGVPATFTFTANYKGTFKVVMFDPQNNPISTPNPCTVTVTPQVSSYFQAWQNDAASGGGFRNPGTTTCNTNYPSYVNPSSARADAQPNPDYYGGIIANSSTTNATDKQSRSDFGAVALGVVPFGSGTGFYSAKNTYFANSLGGVYASDKGYFDSVSASKNHCVKDYYTDTRIDPANIQSEPDIQSAISACQPDPTTSERRCQYTLSSNSISGNITIPQGLQLTLYASGDVNISANITYGEPFDPRNKIDIPYFALITQGNVTLTNSTTQLDGLYVVQPTPSGSGIVAGSGTFATCDNQCNSQLVVNGAVIAQHVELLRAHGSSQSLGGPAAAAIGNAPAEIFNFVPSMVLGAPDFPPLCPSGCTQGLFSLAPVF